MEETFKNKNIIYMSSSNIFQVDNIEELNTVLFGEEYNDLSEDKKIDKRMSLIQNEMLTNDVDIISKRVISKYSEQLLNCIIIDDVARIYEKKDSNKFLDKKIINDDYFELFNNLKEKYIYIGDKYNKILKQYIEESD